MMKHGQGYPQESSRARRTRRGFTVIEVLLSIGIVTIGFASIFALLGHGSGSHRDAVDMTQASILASSVFDDMALNYALYADNNHNNKPDAWEDGNGNGIEDRFESQNGQAPLADRMPAATGYDFKLRIDYTRSATREVMVTCTVFWRDSADLRAQTFRRLLFLKHDP